jgi:phosphate uptake regulator
MKETQLKDELVLEANNYVARDVVKNSLSGVESITVLAEKEIEKDIRKDIKFFIDGLPNTYIIEESKQRIVIQNLGYKKVPTHKLIKRLLYLVCDMFENLRESDIDDLERNFKQLRKFYFILVTHIRTYLRTGIYVSEDKDFTPVEAMDFRMFCQKIEQIGVILLNLRVNSQVEDFFILIEEYFNQVLEAFLKKDYDLAYKIWFKRDKLVKQAKELMNTLEYTDVDKLKDMMAIAHACKDMSALI